MLGAAKQVILVVYGPALDPERITGALKIRPSRQNWPSPVVEDSDGTLVQLDEPGRWVLESSSLIQADDLREHYAFINGLLRVGQEQLRKALLASNATMELTVVVHDRGEWPLGAHFKRMILELDLPAEVEIVEAGEVFEEER